MATEMMSLAEGMRGELPALSMIKVIRSLSQALQIIALSAMKASTWHLGQTEECGCCWLIGVGLIV